MKTKRCWEQGEETLLTTESGFAGVGGTFMNHMMKKEVEVPELWPAATTDAEANDEEQEEEDVERAPLAERLLDGAAERVPYWRTCISCKCRFNAVSFNADFWLATRALPAAIDPQQLPQQQALARARAVAQGRVAVQQQSTDRGLILLAIALTVVIIALFMKKRMKSSGVPDVVPQ